MILTFKQYVLIVLTSIAQFHQWLSDRGNYKFVYEFFLINTGPTYVDLHMSMYIHYLSFEPNVYKISGKQANKFHRFQATMIFIQSHLHQMTNTLTQK